MSAIEVNKNQSQKLLFTRQVTQSYRICPDENS